MLEKEQVQHIAGLARLKLTPEEIKKFQKDLSLILDYVNTLKRADISEQEIDLSQIIEKLPDIERVGERRQDKALSFYNRDKLLDLMSQRKKDYLKTKPIIKK
jgi:aspartyl/glutamyl-tRNA(Asn/Gln) amidotransferase C subunit